ncbi:DUF4249 family protein [uncultured Croceitalea sp.]|uniref:DUF4249 family protein n=1 Tax=uncultured Croceitalea sp. TaxID=1798908 RepID=UPI0033068345
MKKLVYCIVLFAIISCEDVIDVGLPPTQTKLVVNALIRVDTADEFVPIEVKVTETSDFFSSNQVTQLVNATIFYGFPENGTQSTEGLNSSSLIEVNPNTGVYRPEVNDTDDQRIKTTDIEPGMVFILVMNHKNVIYTARTTYVETVPIDALEQGSATLFDEDDIEVLVTITDIPDEENHYVFDFGFNEFLPVDDQFIDGQQFQFSYFYDDLSTGQTVEIGILGADKSFHDYMNLILEQTERNAGVFETPVATIRGNVINNSENNGNPELSEEFALGYFAVVQEFKRTLTLE